MNAVQNANRWASLQIAGTYVGTVVGAGFASGQEVLRFFSLYGYLGTFGLLVSVAVLGLYGVATLRLGQMLQVRSHRDLFLAVAGPWLGRLVDWVITGFLFAGTGVMIAGSGAIFREQFQLPELTGNLVMALAAAATVAFGLKGVVRAVALVAPVLIVAVVGVGLYSLSTVDGWWLRHQELPSAWDGTMGGLTGMEVAAPHWLLAGVLYASYNLLLAIPILAPLGVAMPGARLHWKGGLLGGLGLGLAGLAIHLALVAQLPEVVQFEVPMLFLARGAFAGLPVLYALVLWAEVYTTAVAGLYGVTARLVSGDSRLFPLVAVVVALGAMVVGRVGFAELVLTLYPVVGYLGIGVLVVVPWFFISRVRRT